MNSRLVGKSKWVTELASVNLAQPTHSWEEGIAIELLTPERPLGMANLYGIFLISN